MQQTQVIAAAAAGVAAEGLAPREAKVEAENAAQLSVALVENAIVILMLVEDHLRLQSKIYTTSRFPAVSPSPLSAVLPVGRSSTMVGEPLETVAEHKSSSGDSAGLPLDVCIKLRGYIHAFKQNTYLGLYWLITFMLTISMEKKTLALL